MGPRVGGRWSNLNGSSKWLTSREGEVLTRFSCIDIRAIRISAGEKEQEDPGLRQTVNDEASARFLYRQFESMGCCSKRFLASLVISAIFAPDVVGFQDEGVPTRQRSIFKIVSDFLTPSHNLTVFVASLASFGLPVNDLEAIRTILSNRDIWREADFNPLYDDIYKAVVKEFEAHRSRPKEPSATGCPKWAVSIFDGKFTHKAAHLLEGRRRASTTERSRSCVQVRCPNSKFYSRC